MGARFALFPIALKRVEALFCKNERAVVHVKHELSANDILLVPVAAVLVASIRLHFLDVLLKDASEPCGSACPSRNAIARFRDEPS